jgi:hypothetical protein
MRNPHCDVFTLDPTPQEASHVRKYVAVNDYGMVVSGSRLRLRQLSSSSRYPQLRVVTVGDPERVTAEKYTEIVNDWIGPHMPFSLERPSGWLAASGDALSAEEPG